MASDQFTIGAQRRGVSHRVRCLLALCLLTLAACDAQQQEPAPASSASTQTAPTDDLLSLDDDSPSQRAQRDPMPAAVDTLLKEWTEEGLALTSTLRETVEHFVRAPTATGRESAMHALAAAHAHLQIWQTLRKLGIYDPELDLNRIEPEVAHSIWIRLDQQPLIPGYLDAVPGYPQSGLIFREEPLDMETLNREHQFTDSAYVAIGFHALEFMLSAADNASTERATAFAALPDQSRDALRDAKLRRSLYVLLLANQIDDDMQRLLQAWQPKTGNYYRQLANLPHAQRARGPSSLQERLEREPSDGHMRTEEKQFVAQRLKQLGEAMLADAPTQE